MSATAAPATADVSSMDFRRAMRRPASAVAIVATGNIGRRAGVTVTAVCSLSDRPPSLLICIYCQSAVLEPIRANGRFSVNYLGAEHAELASLFAGQRGVAGDARFEPSDWSILRTGAPVLTSAVASFDCYLDREIDSPTHAVLFGRVAALMDRPESRKPPQKQGLIYSEGAFGRFDPLPL
ncbi:flavin reductase family protein [Pseudoruegeria sp. HB172150]|uniref:flavin reductase family protein n=1 Tax=Pseudoruegeria sp. HB172150 TaxID=2721164 RepID=UPI0015529A34|nr:flavin reductase family protein [Pseudoruegeria sp. HB172150]